MILGLIKAILDMTLKANVNKKKIDKWDLIKIGNCFKGHPSRKPKESDKIFTNNILMEGLYLPYIKNTYN